MPKRAVDEPKNAIFLLYLSVLESTTQRMQSRRGRDIILVRSELNVDIIVIF